MKRIWTLLVFVFMVVDMQAQKQISYIEETKNWYYVYDEAGKKIGGLSRSSVGDLKGWGNDFFVAKYYSFYRIYDAKGKVLKAMNVSDVGEIVGAARAALRVKVAEVTSEATPLTTHIALYVVVAEHGNAEEYVELLVVGVEPSVV